MSTLALLHFDELPGARVGTVSARTKFPIDMVNQDAWYGTGTGLAIGANGVFGSSLINTSSTGVSLQSNVFTIPPAYTIEARYKFTGTAIKAIGLSGSGLMSRIELENGIISYRGNDGTANTLVASSATYTNDVWVALALVVQNELASLYVDGTRVLLDVPTTAIATQSLWVSLGVASEQCAIDELRFSDEALYTGDSYELASEPFEPVFIGKSSISQIQAISPEPAIEDLPVFKSSISQIQAISPTSDTETLPVFKSSISQIQAISPITTHVDLGIFATYLTQLRHVQLVSQLTGMPLPRTYITQIKAHALDVQPVSTEPLVYSIDKQVISGTEPPEFTRFYKVDQLALKQEFIPSQVQFFTVKQQLVIEEERPNDPPTRLFYNTSTISSVDLIPAPQDMRSYSWVHAVLSNYSNQETLQDPTAMQSATMALLGQLSASRLEVMRDPATLQASTVAYSNASTASIVETLAPSTDLRGHSSNVQLQSNTSIVEPFDNPGIVQSNTRQVNVTGATSIAEVFNNPEILLSSTLGLNLGATSSEHDEFNDPSNLTSTIVAKAASNMLSEAIADDDPVIIQSPTLNRSLTKDASIVDTLDNPSILQSPTLNRSTNANSSIVETLSDPASVQSSTINRTASSVPSIVDTYRDPNTITQTVLHLLDISGTSVQDPYVAPNDIRSTSKTVNLIAHCSEPEEYIDPKSLYEYPARQYSAYSLFSLSERYNNPTGSYAPVVNINYYWASL